MWSLAGQLETIGGDWLAMNVCKPQLDSLDRLPVVSEVCHLRCRLTVTACRGCAVAVGRISTGRCCEAPGFEEIAEVLEAARCDSDKSGRCVFIE